MAITQLIICGTKSHGLKYARRIEEINTNTRFAINVDISCVKKLTIVVIQESDRNKKDDCILFINPRFL
jgi:hypothetical protein